MCKSNMWGNVHQQLAVIVVAARVEGACGPMPGSQPCLYRLCLFFPSLRRDHSVLLNQLASRDLSAFSVSSSCLSVVFSPLGKTNAPFRSRHSARRSGSSALHLVSADRQLESRAVHAFPANPFSINSFAGVRCKKQISPMRAAHKRNLHSASASRRH